MALGLYPLPSQETLNSVFEQLATELRRHRFEQTIRLPDPGRPYHALNEAKNARRFIAGANNAFESSALPELYWWAFGRSNPEALALFRFFHLGESLPSAVLRRILPGSLVDALVDLSMLVPTNGAFVSRLRATGFSPLIQMHDTRSIREEDKSSMVFCGRCSSRLLKAVRDEMSTRPRGARALDLCTGSGIQALNAAPWFDEVVGADINPRAVTVATANAQANGIQHSRFIQSNLFESVEGKFDLVTANTPFLLLDEGSNARDGYGGKYGMEVELRLVQDLDGHLAPGGVALLVVSSAFVDGENLLDSRLREIFAGKGYQVDLNPISQYYSTDHFRAYEELGVRKCVLYIMRAEKVGATLSVRVHDWKPAVKLVLDVKVVAQREIARAKHARRQSASIS